MSPSHTYTADGSYNVTLTVTDASGSTSSTTTTATIAEAGPSVAITGAPASSPPGQTISLGSSVSDPDPADQGGGFTYAWSVTDNGAAYASGTASTFSLTPGAAGTYVVTLSATATKDGASNSTTSAIQVGSNSGPILLPPSVLSNLQQEASTNTPQWQAFKARLDQNLPVVLNEGSYEGSELNWVVDYALGYQVLQNIDPATAANYANKALALIQSGLNDYQKGSWEARQFLTLGDGVTTTFPLPNTGVIPSSVRVFLAPTTTTAVVHKATNGQDPVGYYLKFLQVSDTSTGPATYTQGTDWSHNPNYDNNLIDWSTAAHQPAAGATYYVTTASEVNSTSTSFTLSGNTVTLSAAPTTSQAVFVEYVYNSPTLTYQQTSAGDGGFNSMLIDTGYTSRYLGKDLALGLDWLDTYSGFSAALKQSLESMLVRWSDYWRDNGYRVNSPESNYGAGGYVSRVMTALALANRDPVNGPRLMSEVETYRQNYVVPMLTNPTNSLAGGFWSEGWNYGALATENLMLAGLALEEKGAISSATAERAWATQAIDDLVSSQATPSSLYDAGDWYAHPAPFPGKALFYVLGTMANDPAAQGYANYIIQNYSNGANTADSLDLLFRNPSASASYWSALPLQDFATGTGLLTARSDWGTTPTWVSMQMGNILAADHQYDAPGMMEIRRGADELLVNGNALGGNQVPSTKSTYANTVVVDDGGAGTQNYPYAMGLWYGTPGIVVNAYEATANYAYLSGDYHAAYSKNTAPGAGGPTSELNREMVYLRPGYVLVYDRVTTTQASFTKQLRWSFANAPTVSGNSFVETAGSSKLFGQEFSTLPLTTTLTPTTVAGATVQQVITQNATTSASVRYVTAFQVTDSTVAAMDPTQHLLTTSQRMEGVMIGNQVVLFGRNGTVDLSTPETYQITASGTTQHLLTDVTPGQVLRVFVNGVQVTTVTASSQGTVSFTTSGTGPQTIQVGV
jgi:PKD repeat protein